MVVELSISGAGFDATATVEVECLCCGTRRAAGIWEDGRLDAGVCLWCGDVGWARPTDLSDDQRLAIRAAVATAGWGTRPPGAVL